jgi:hypothetical protein
MDTHQQQSPDVQRSNPRWVLITVEPNLPNETCPTSLPPLQPAQCPIEMWGIFMPHPVLYQRRVPCLSHLYVHWITTFWTLATIALGILEVRKPSHPVQSTLVKVEIPSIGTVQFDVIKSFISPTNAHLNCFKMLKSILNITINVSTCFGLTKPSSGSLQSVLR